MPALDRQIKQNFSTPQKCSKGCARWANLREDGNTRNQAEVNAKWAGGSPPDGVGNMCAMPANDQADGPWCYCAGTDDGSWGYCQEKEDRNATSAVCRSTPNGLRELNAKIDGCTSTTEINRNTNFAENTYRLQKDIESSTGTVQDSLVMGDTMFGQYGYQDIAKQVKDRNTELKSKKEILVRQVDKNEAIIERSNRDFSDVKDTVPEPQVKQTLRFIEDYTLAFLSLAYLFMIVAIIYLYVLTSEQKLPAFGKIFAASIFLSMFLFMALHYLS